MSILIITKVHNSLNIAHRVIVLVLCTSPYHGLNMYRVREKYLKRFKSYGVDMISILIITKGHKSIFTACSYSSCSLHIL